MNGLQRFLTAPLMQSRSMSMLSTRFFGWLAELKLPKPVLRLLIKRYAKAFAVDMDKYDFSIGSVSTFQEFFSRRIKSEYCQFKGTLSSPVEASVASFGVMEEGQLLQVKGVSYPIDKLVADNAFSEGSYLTLYLGLGDYHHVHMPFDAHIERVMRVDGARFATNLRALKQRRDVYLQNERLIFSGQCDHGRFYLVLVGATCVGKIKYPAYATAGASLVQGQLVGSFEMGSTVVLITEGQGLAETQWELGEKLNLGQSIIS